jgi:glycosyltransferase involved in cell wall biosynthesis
MPALAHRCYRGSVLATLPIVTATAINRRTWATLPSAYIFVSDAHRRALAPLSLPADRSFVKWNLVPHTPSATSSTPHTSRNEGLVVYLGRLDKAKGIAELMQARESLRDTAPLSPLRLAIGGGGSMASEVRSWAAPRSDVTVLGLLDRDGCQALLSRASAVVIPSLASESFGLVAVEAFAAGAPVIVAAHGALPELVDDGITGGHFRPGDAQDLARVLRHLAENPDLWRARGTAARRCYEDRFDPESNLQQLLSVYRFAIENPVHRAELAVMSRTR